jgi:chaperonin GroEL
MVCRPDKSSRKSNTRVGIKGSSLTNEQLEDLAIYTGGIVIDEEKKMNLEEILKKGGIENPFDFLGQARRIVADKDNTTIIEGKGSQKKIKERIAKIKEEKKVEKTDLMKLKMDQRIASLAGGVGMIRVAAHTTIESRYLKHKIEDAVHATQLAMKEGVVKGGGLALYEIAKQLPDDCILKEALKAPYNKIQDNAGGKLTIGKDILDPVKVTITCLENACSLAGIFITTESAIAWERGALAEELEKFMGTLDMEKKRVGKWRGAKDDENNPDSVIQEEELD